MICSSCGTEYLQNGHSPGGVACLEARIATLGKTAIRVGVAVLIKKGTKLLLGRRAKEPNRGAWVIPGGGIGHGESWRGAGEREVLEETGLTINLDEAGAPFPLEIINGQEHRLILVVDADGANGELRAGDDLSEVHFFAPPELPWAAISPAVVPALRAFGYFEPSNVPERMLRDAAVLNKLTRPDEPEPHMTDPDHGMKAPPPETQFGQSIIEKILPEVLAAGKHAAPDLREEEEVGQDCAACGEESPKNECPKSKRPCGHHCNHSWSDDSCCWCGEEFGEEPAPQQLSKNEGGSDAQSAAVDAPPADGLHERRLCKPGDAGVVAGPSVSFVTADDHPGGPLSRAERVVLSTLKKTVFRARVEVSGLSHILGAVPGAQKIEVAHKAALTAIDRLLETFKRRKEGAPLLRGAALTNWPARGE